MAFTISDPHPNTRQSTTARRLLTAALGLLIIAIVILSWVPPVSRDALTHHLAVPKLYLQHGGIYEIPSIGFSYYPMNLDLLYLIPLYFGNDILPKLIHFAFALLTAVFIYAHVRSRLGNTYALTGAVLFLSLPVVVKLSIQVYVDLGLIFFSFASLTFLLRWLEPPHRLAHMLLSAVFCGLALGTKYNALIVWVLLTLFIPPAYLRMQRSDKQAVRSGFGSGTVGSAGGKAVGWALLFAAVALMVYSPWAIRNIRWRGNPVYPLYHRLLTGHLPLSTNDEANEEEARRPVLKKPSGSTIGPLARRKLLYDEPWWYTALMPVRIFFQGRDDDPERFDGRLNPYLIILPAFAIGLRRKASVRFEREKAIWFWFAALYFLIAFFSVDMRIRYIAPIIPPLIVLSVFGLHDLMEWLRRSASQRVRTHGPALVGAGLGLLLVLNAAYVARQFAVVQPLGYISGRVNRDTYIARFRYEYPVIQFANRHLPPDVRILGLFMGWRSYYLERELVFDQRLFQSVIQAEATPEKVCSELQRQGYTHLLIRYDLFKNWATSALEPSARAAIAGLLRNESRLLISRGGYGLYELALPR